jgi:hypothetical protein
MDFPSISKQRGASHHYSTRGGCPASSSSSSHYYGSTAAAEKTSAMADGLWSDGNNNHSDPYRYAPSSTVRDGPVAPYRHQGRSRRPAAGTEESMVQQRRAMVLDRVPQMTDRQDPMTNPSSRTYGEDYGGGGGSSRSFYLRVPDDRYVDALFSYGKSITDNNDHFYTTAQDHYPGNQEMPSLVGSDHSSFELPSDDDEENGWDRKIRPEEKMSSTVTTTRNNNDGCPLSRGFRPSTCQQKKLTTAISTHNGLRSSSRGSRPWWRWLPLPPLPLSGNKLRWHRVNGCPCEERWKRGRQCRTTFTCRRSVSAANGRSSAYKMLPLCCVRNVRSSVPALARTHRPVESDWALPWRNWPNGRRILNGATRRRRNNG